MKKIILTSVFLTAMTLGCVTSMVRGSEDPEQTARGDVAKGHQVPYLEYLVKKMIPTDIFPTSMPSRVKFSLTSGLYACVGVLVVAAFNSIKQ